MNLPQWIFVCLAAAFGTLALKVVGTALRHGVVRHRHYFGPVAHRDEAPFDYYTGLTYWLIYLAACYGFVGFQLLLAFAVNR